MNELIACKNSIFTLLEYMIIVNACLCKSFVSDFECKSRSWTLDPLRWD